MTSVAYPAEPQLPGWVHTAVSLIAGWLLGAAATGALYGLGIFFGAIDSPYGSHPGVVNEWPYHGDDLWSLLANVSVIVIVLVLTTIATSFVLRRKQARLSDGRLAVVLLFTGWIPLATERPIGGVFGFLVALVLIRYWVARHDGQLAIADAAVLVGIFSAVVLSYGLLHPLWTRMVLPTAAAGNSRNAKVVVHNAGRVGITIDVDSIPGFGPLRPSRLHLAPGSDGVLTMAVPRGGCGAGVFGLHARYHMLGLTLRETLPARISFGHC